MSQAESFLRRWSRLKRQSAASVALPQSLAMPQAPASEAEFEAFLNPEVERGVRQAALRTLFMTDHYRTMDGLDVYVGDYSNPEGLPAAMLDRLEHARELLRKEEPEQATKAPDTSQDEQAE